MNTLTVKVKGKHNDAFAFGAGPGEMIRILSDISAKIHNGRTEGGIQDVNGNTVGEWSTK
jgi:hypothetical protein